MKRQELVGIVEKQLAEIGFIRGSWLWQPHSAQLVIVIGSTLKAITLRTGMTKKALTFEMGRLAGLAEAAGMAKPVTKSKANGLDITTLGGFSGLETALVA